MLLNLQKRTIVRWLTSNFLILSVSGNISVLRWISSVRIHSRRGSVLMVLLSAAGSPFTILTCFWFPIQRPPGLIHSSRWQPSVLSATLWILLPGKVTVVIPVLLLKRLRLTWSLPELLILHTLVLKPNSLFLMMSVTRQVPTNHSIRSIPLRVPGTPGGMNSRIWVTNHVTKKVTSPVLQLTHMSIFATKLYRC